MPIVMLFAVLLVGLCPPLGIPMTFLLLMLQGKK